MPIFRFCRELPRGLAARVRSLRRDTVGGVAVVVGIAAPVLVGSMGLGGEAGYWYLKQRSLQNAADVAAHASAMRLAAGDDSATLRDVAEYMVEQSDVDLANGSLDLNNPPINGTFIEDGDAIEIVVTETFPRLFSAMYSNEPIQISARAVATAQGGGTGCVLALNGSEEGALTVSGSPFLFLTMCDLVTNSTAGAAYLMGGLGSSVSANCVQASGTAQTTAMLSIICDSPRENAAPVSDPLATVPEPAAVGACQDAAVTDSDLAPAESHPSGLSSIRFCNGLELSGTVNLDPGLYIVEGGAFRINANATVNGDGVVFFLADGVNLEFSSTATVNLSAPTGGDYNGITIFGSRSATAISHVIDGNAGTSINGAVYLPASDLTWSGNAQTSFTGCTQVIADTVNFTGSGFISLHCLFPSGPTIQMAGDVRVVE